RGFPMLPGSHQGHWLSSLTARRQARPRPHRCFPGGARCPNTAFLSWDELYALVPGSLRMTETLKPSRHTRVPSIYRFSLVLNVTAWGCFVKGAPGDVP